jgi:hypothetical protein
MAFLSVFSIFTVVNVLLFVIIGGSIHSKEYGEGKVGVFDAVGIFLCHSLATDVFILHFMTKTIIGLFEKFGSIVFALSCASASLDAYSSMKEPTTPNCSYVFSWSVILGATLCIIMGISKKMIWRHILIY